MRHKDSLLWRLGSEPPYSYIFGTMHVRDQLAYTYVQLAEQYVKSCDAYFGEIDMAEAVDMSKPEDFEIPNGQTLHELIGTRKYEKAVHILKKSVDIDLKPIQRLYPIVLMNMVAERMLQNDHAIPLDQFLWNWALDQGKIMGGIESYEEQKETLNQIAIESQCKQFNDMWRNISSYRKRVLDLSELYAKGKIHSLYKRSIKGMGQMKQLMIIKRNQNMAQRMVSRLDDSTFYAIGAGHLGGYHGLIHLLKKSGRTCIPISVDPPI